MIMDQAAKNQAVCRPIMMVAPHSIARRTLFQVRLVRALCVLAVISLFGCASHFVMSRTPGAYDGTLGPMKRCPVGQGPCTDDPSYDSSKFNPSNASLYALPNCPFGIQALVVPEPGSSDALVQCAAPPQQAPRQPDGGIPITNLAPAR
jgi:hypothetical protein